MELLKPSIGLQYNTSTSKITEGAGKEVNILVHRETRSIVREIRSIVREIRSIVRESFNKQNKQNLEHIIVEYRY